MTARGRWAKSLIASAIMITMASVGGNVFAQGITVTQVDYADGKAVSATTVDPTTGMTVPTQGAIDPATGQYSPTSGPIPSGAGAPEQAAQSAGTPGSGAGFFTGGQWSRFEANAEPPKFQDIESYRLISWYNIWR